jgi:CBS domain-containing protein
MVQRPIKKIMTKDVIVANLDDSLKEIIKKLSKNDISGMPVIDEDNKLVGMICESDILDALESKSSKFQLIFPSSHALGMTFERSSEPRELKETLNELGKMKAKSIMTKELLTASPENTISEVSILMANHDINRVPVVNKDKLVGIVTRGDIIRGLSKVK